MNSLKMPRNLTSSRRHQLAKDLVSKIFEDFNGRTFMPADEIHERYFSQYPSAMVRRAIRMANIKVIEIGGILGWQVWQLPPGNKIN